MSEEERIRWREYGKNAHVKSKANPKLCSNKCGRTAAPRRSLCNTCRSTQWRQEHPEYNATYQTKRRRELKQEVIGLYGGRCTCCGESEIIFLCFDHVVPVKLTKDERPWGGSQQLLDAKKRHGDGYYQLLCFNCNFAKSQGKCPHQG